MSAAPHRFSLRQLQYAAAVAEALSFSRAARRCSVSQPSLSAQIAALEEALGARLFERDRRRVLLTPAGKSLIERARRILGDVDDLADWTRRSADPLRGTLRLGVIPTLAAYFIPRVRPAMRRAYPELGLLWTEEKTSAIVAKLNAGALDGAFVALESEIGDLEREIVGFDPFVLASRRGHPLTARSRPLRVGEIGSERLLLLDDGHCFRDQVLAFCARTGAVELEFRATSLPTLAQMVADGAGVTLLPRIAVAMEAGRARLAVRAFATPAPGRTIAMVWRRRSPLGPALRRIARTAREASGDLRRDVPRDPLPARQEPEALRR